eukprot:scaffold1724_cov341-Pavlova_lutheri.AAC.70
MKSEPQVTWEDQQNINTFGRLNTRFQELEQEILASKVRRTRREWRTTATRITTGTAADVLRFDAWTS